jgi:hypothetical protein
MPGASVVVSGALGSASDGVDPASAPGTAAVSAKLASPPGSGPCRPETKTGGASALGGSAVTWPAPPGSAAIWALPGDSAMLSLLPPPPQADIRAARAAAQRLDMGREEECEMKAIFYSSSLATTN